MPAGIFGRYHGRRQWYMLESSSIGQRRLTCLLEGSHACWQKVWRNWLRSWSVTSPFSMKRYSKDWPFQRRHLLLWLRKQFPRAWGQCLPIHLSEELSWGQPRTQSWRREFLSSLGRKRFYIHHDPWWLPDRFPIHQEVQGWGKNEWSRSPILNHPGLQPPCR